MFLRSNAVVRTDDKAVGSGQVAATILLLNFRTPRDRAKTIANQAVVEWEPHDLYHAESQRRSIRFIVWQSQGWK